MEILSLVKEVTNTQSASCSDLEIESITIQTIQKEDNIFNDVYAYLYGAKIGDKYLQIKLNKKSDKHLYITFQDDTRNNPDKNTKCNLTGWEWEIGQSIGEKKTLLGDNVNMNECKQLCIEENSKNTEFNGCNFPIKNKYGKNFLHGQCYAEKNMKENRIETPHWLSSYIPQNNTLYFT